MSKTENIEQEARPLSYLDDELGTLEIGDNVEFTIDGEFVARIHFDETSIKDEFMLEIVDEFNLIANDNQKSLVEMFLVKNILLRASS